MSTNSNKGKKIYLKIRNQCGLMGILLPWLALFSASIAEHPGPDWWWSISATYYQSPVLVAVMAPSCLVLFNYIGYDWLDNLITDLSALFGMGIILFPCKVSWIADGTPVGFFQIPIETSHFVHMICSAIFFFLIAFNFIFLFTKSKPGKEPGRRKKIRNWIYRICGIITLILQTIFIFTALGYIPKFIHIYLEIVMMTIYGFSWLVKGEFFPFLNDKDSED